MKEQKDVAKKLNKIWAIINNLAQERRIKSDELDDFNQAFLNLNQLFDSMSEAIEMMESESSKVELIKNQYIEQVQKLELCLELCGMSKKGIDYLLNFPSRFLEVAFSIRLRHKKALETEMDFFWLDRLWKGINLQIQNDIDSFNQATFFKKLCLEANSKEKKQLAIKMMNDFANDKNLQYLKSKLGKEIEENELSKIITNHWYEIYINSATTEKH